MVIREQTRAVVAAIAVKHLLSGDGDEPTLRSVQDFYHAFPTSRQHMVNWIGTNPANRLMLEQAAARRGITDFNASDYQDGLEWFHENLNADHFPVSLVHELHRRWNVYQNIGDSANLIFNVALQEKDGIQW